MSKDLIPWTSTMPGETKQSLIRHLGTDMFRKVRSAWACLSAPAQFHIYSRARFLEFQVSQGDTNAASAAKKLLVQEIENALSKEARA